MSFTHDIILPFAVALCDYFVHKMYRLLPKEKKQQKRVVEA